MTPVSLARAFVDVAKTLPQDEIPALAEAAAHLLLQQGLLKAAQTFPRLVEREWFRSTGEVQIRITTMSGHAGTLKKDVAHIVEQTLKRSCHIEEQTDASVLGGVLLQIGDERYDATLRGALADAAARLTKPIPIS
ncbi:MAG: F0F1 ATP synthase subunit delta [Candidatus Peregrinibacteria bacterium]